jgi:hypothetical protein
MSTGGRARWFAGLGALTALTLAACRQPAHPERAVVALFDAAKSGDCQTVARELVRRSREALLRDQQACGQLIAHLNAHALQNIQRVALDGRSPGFVLVTATLTNSNLSRTLTVESEDNAWKVSSF